MKEEAPDVTIYTGCFKKNGEYPGAISIADGPPYVWRRDGKPEYRKLAPTPEIRSGYARGGWSWEQYVKAYEKDVLDKLFPGDVVEELRRMSAPYPPCILCWEEPKYDEKGQRIENCHRQLVAEWLKKAGFKVNEREV